MVNRWAFAALTLFSTSTFAANFATCILDKMPGTAKSPG